MTKAGPNDKYGDSEGNWEKHVAAYKETMRYAYTGDLHRKMHPEMASLGRPGERQAQGRWRTLIGVPQ